MIYSSAEMWINGLRNVAAISSGAIMVTSTGLVALAIALRDHLLPFQDFMLFYTKFLAVVIVVVGALDFLVAAVGLLASLRRLHRLLLAVCVLLGITLSVKISIFSIAFLLKPAESWSVETCFKDQMVRYKSKPSLIDDLQIDLHCCGGRNPNDWFNVTGYIPASCCQGITIGEPCRIEAGQVIAEGCVQKLQGLVPEDWLIVMAILLVIQEAIQISTIAVMSYMTSKLASEETNNPINQKDRTESANTLKSELHWPFDDYFMKKGRANSRDEDFQKNGKVRSKGLNRNPLANADSNWIL